MSDPLQRLIAFDRAARELAATRELLGGVPEEMRSLHEEYAGARAEIEALEGAALEAKRARAAAEGAIADAQEKLRKYQAQVPMVRNQREYGALLTEIDGAKAEIRRLDEIALSAIEAAESAAVALEERRSGFADLEARHAAGLEEWERRKPEVARQADQLEHETAKLREELPRAVVAQYSRIAQHYKGQALSALRRAETPGTTQVWFCSSCNYQVRPQVAVEVKSKGSIVQCEGCRRFFHLPEAE